MSTTAEHRKTGPGSLCPPTQGVFLYKAMWKAGQSHPEAKAECRMQIAETQDKAKAE
jgi:hypothetical protein